MYFTALAPKRIICQHAWWVAKADSILRECLKRVLIFPIVAAIAHRKFGWISNFFDPLQHTTDLFVNVRDMFYFIKPAREWTE